MANSQPLNEKSSLLIKVDAGIPGSKEARKRAV